MARMNPGRFGFGLIAEITGIVVIVSLLPKIPLGEPSAEGPVAVADQRPSLALPVAKVGVNRNHDWRSAVRRELEPETIPPVDPLYVERRLDQAGQQLLSGVSSYFTNTAREVLRPNPQRTSPAELNP